MGKVDTKFTFNLVVNDMSYLCPGSERKMTHQEEIALGLVGSLVG